MAKSLRSKIKQRYRRAKRQYIEQTLHTERICAAHDKVKKIQQGLAIQGSRPKNAFLYPDDPEAVFAQKELPRVIDFRSENLPLSGYAVSGARRAFSDEEKLALGLVVRAKDGLLESEKRQRAAEQRHARMASLHTQHHMDDIVDTPPSEATTSARPTEDATSTAVVEEVPSSFKTQIDTASSRHDEEDLVVTFQSMDLNADDVPEFSIDAPSSLEPSVPMLQNLKVHQDKVGGRSRLSTAIPKVKNTLKSHHRKKKQVMTRHL